MAASDPHQQQGGKPGRSGSVPPGSMPQAQPVEAGPRFPEGSLFPEALPLSEMAASSVPELVAPQPLFPQAQPPFPQAQPVAPQQPVPAAQPIPQGQGYAAAGPRPVLVTGKAPSTAVQEPAGEPEEELATIALKNAPPWLVSAVFHMMLMIVLGLLFLPQLARNQIELETVWAERLGDQLEFDSFMAGTAADMVEEPVYTPQNLPEVEDPFAAPPDVTMLVPDGSTSTSEIDASQIGIALSGREEGSKRALLGAYGGNATTEGAVQAGLRWLARNQRKDGSWSLTGPYADGAVSENEVAATAMALLAFQGAGNTHKKGTFQTNVARAWDWLLKEQDGDGNFFHEGPFNHMFYTNGQCAIALCELYGMSRDEKLREPAQRAISFLLKSQSTEGGWRYSPQADSDVSVTGWVVMALQSARMAGLEVPESNLRRVERFLDKMAADGGTRYRYQAGRQPTVVMTAEALLCRQYLGWRRDDERLVEGVRYLTQPENLINYHNEPNVYYWYYATQVCHHMEGEDWKKWNTVMRQAVPEQQVKRGREEGSWDPRKPRPDAWEDHGGRLYVTCLSIYMLEVYYRHLPIYSKVYSLLRRM